MAPEDWLGGWSGESTDELLALAGRYRLDSIVLAFEQALGKKRFGGTPLSREEQFVCAIEALEREVNNGGYHQFFWNSSNEWVGVVVDALEAVGCPMTGEITRDAIRSLELGAQLDPQTVRAAADRADDDEDLSERLEVCDRRYFEGLEEPISTRLFDWIARNRERIRV